MLQPLSLDQSPGSQEQPPEAKLMTQGVQLKFRPHGLSHPLLHQASAER